MNINLQRQKRALLSENSDDKENGGENQRVDLFSVSSKTSVVRHLTL